MEGRNKNRNGGKVRDENEVMNNTTCPMQVETEKSSMVQGRKRVNKGLYAQKECLTNICAREDLPKKKWNQEVERKTVAKG